MVNDIFTRLLTRVAAGRTFRFVRVWGGLNVLLRRLVLAAVLAVGSAGAAVAAPLIDFTDTTIWKGKDAGATSAWSFANGVHVALTTVPKARLNFTQAFDGPASASYCRANGGALACRGDGLGIVDDEISRSTSATSAPDESVTLDFSKSVGGRVNVTGVHFLDLFRHPSGRDFESAVVYRDGDRSTEVSFAAIVAYQSNGGYLFSNLLWSGVRSLTFYAGPGNDGRGKSDFALAGVEVSAIPLPAGVWLLLGGVAALAAAGRPRPA